MAQQTAVNFLINYMCANFHLTDESLQKFDQALAMEKEQIVNSHIEGQRVFDKHDHTQWTTDQAEQYYIETYKNK